MKKTFIASQILLAINLFILIVPPSVFLIAFRLFPSINSTENGLGAYPLFFIVCGIVGLFVTIPLSAIMIVLYLLYKYKFNKKDLLLKVSESTNMKINIDRQSICMGDDMESHKKLHEISNTITFLELFNKLIEDNYFPYTGENNIVWVLRFNGKDKIAWKTKENTFIEYNEARYLLSKNQEVTPMIVFKYYSSFKEWEDTQSNAKKNQKE